MKRYHINNETGDISECKAVTKCPFGDLVDNHYDNRESAQAAYEKSMKRYTISTHTIGKLQNKTAHAKLSDIFNPKDLISLIKSKHVIVSEHPDDISLKILSYSNLAQIEGKWNDVTKSARGLIIRSNKKDFSDAVIIERPWKKFFTLSQHESGWALGDEEEGSGNSAVNELDNLDFDAPAEVTDKMDGSLGILYTAPDGKLAFSTKGSFISDQAKMYTKMLRENPKYYEAAEKLKKENPNTTFLYELIGQENQVVIAYDDDDMTFLGAVDKKTGVYYSTEDYKDVWNPDEGLNSAEKMPATTLREALELPDRENKEGVVVRIISDTPEGQFQIKIKQEDYLKLHRLVTGISNKAARDLLRESSPTYRDIFSIADDGKVERIPEINKALSHMRGGKGNFYDKLYETHLKKFSESILPPAKLAKEAYDYVKDMPESYFAGDPREATKNFAISIAKKDRATKGLLFEFFKSRLDGDFDKVLDNKANTTMRSAISNI